MNTVRELHDEAMDLAHQAMIARCNKDFDRAKEYAQKAYLKERQAAELILPNESASEPTRSILYRSAGSLAYQSGEFEQAVEMVNKAFEGSPPLDVQHELNVLLKMIHKEEAATGKE